MLNIPTLNIVSSFLKQRDFEEVRAVRDTETCLSDSVLFLNLEASSIEGLISHIVSSVSHWPKSTRTHSSSFPTAVERSRSKR